jgi:hypothetical protein
VGLPMRRTTLLCLLAALLFASSAQAASTTQILRDCQDDGVLEGHYTVADLRKAERHLPSDIAEYSNCGDVLSRAIDAAAATVPRSTPRQGGGGGGSSRPEANAGGQTSPGVLAPSTPQDAQALATAQTAPAPVQVHGRRVASGFAADLGRNSLPSSLLTVLILIAAAAIALAAPVVRRVVARRRA